MTVPHVRAVAARAGGQHDDLYISGEERGHGRTLSRADRRAGPSLGRVAAALATAAFVLGSHPAFAVPPLVPAAEVADRGLSAWWREHEFIVGRPEDPRHPAVRPLVSAGETTLPASLAGWTPIGDTCASPPSATGAWGDLPLEARADVTGALPVISVWSHDRLVSQKALTKPVSVCALAVGEADLVPGPEVIVAWRMDDVRGFTVFHVPEAVR